MFQFLNHIFLLLTQFPQSDVLQALQSRYITSLVIQFGSHFFHRIIELLLELRNGLSFLPFILAFVLLDDFPLLPAG